VEGESCNAPFLVVFLFSNLYHGSWKPFFDRYESTRKTSGSKSALVYQNVEDPTDVFILFEWDSVTNAKKFGISEDLKKTMGQAGVRGVPHVHIMKEVQKNKA
jgi:hypothetical protein